MIKMCFSCGTSITREYLLLGSHLLRSLAYNTTLPMITITSFLFNNVQQPNDYIYQSTSLNQTTLYIYIYMQSLPYLYDDERPDERTNKYIAQNHNPYTTIHPSTMLFLLSLCHWPIPILSFCSIPFTNFIFL